VFSSFLLAAVEGEPNGKWLPHDINEVIWGTIAFLIVFGVIIWKAGPTISKGFAARPERISGELSTAAETRAQAEAERDRIKAALADSDAEAGRIVAEARTQAEALRIDIEARAVIEADAVRARVGADVASAQRQATNDLSGEVSRLAYGAAEKVVAASLDDDTHQHLIEAYIAQVGTAN